MVKLKKDQHKYIEILEEEYIMLLRNTMVIEALKKAGIGSHPIWRCVQHIMKDKRVEIHSKPVNRQYQTDDKPENIE